MANEVAISASLTVRNGLYNDSFSANNVNADQTAALSISAVLDVATTVETISFGEVAAASYSGWRNLSTATAGTAYIAIGSYDGTNMHELVSLRRGGAALMPLVPSVTIAAKAYGEVGKLQYIVLSE
jgi:hypothetical protein